MGRHPARFAAVAGIAMAALAIAAFSFKPGGTGTAQPLPWRACLAGYTPPDNNASMDFSSLTIPYNPTGDPTKVMRDYHDYMQYDQSTQGHLNSDGLCFVKRNYPSPD